LTLPFALKSPAQVYLAPITHYQTLAAWDLTRGSARFMANSIGFAYVIQNWLGRRFIGYHRLRSGGDLRAGLVLHPKQETDAAQYGCRTDLAEPVHPHSLDVYLL